LDESEFKEFNQLSTFLMVAKDYIKNYTGLEDLDEYADLVLVVYILCQDMYDNRAMYVDSATAEGIAIHNDKIEEGVISADLPNGQKASFYINKGKSKYKITEENGILHYNLKVSVSCDLEGVQGDEYFNTDTGVLEVFQQAVAEAICKKAENTLIVLQSRHGADVVRYGKRLRLSDNALYNKLKNDWDKAFPEIKLTITADVTIRRIGEETFHSKKI
jgi:hypothetical protein